MLKYKVGDKVVVLAGKDKGREGIIEVIYPSRNEALVPGVNVYKKHVKKAVAVDKKGGVYDLPRPISLSKLAILDPKKGKPTRVGFKVEGGKKLRVSKLTGVILDKAGKMTSKVSGQVGKKGSKK
jgi:large subunit ribosomal protein L24